MTSALQPGKSNSGSTSSTAALMMVSPNVGNNPSSPLKNCFGKSSKNQLNNHGKRGVRSSLSDHMKQIVERDESSLVNSKNYFEKEEKETIVNSDRLRLLLFNHKNRNITSGGSSGSGGIALNKQQVTGVDNLLQISVEQQPTKKNNHSQLMSDNCFERNVNFTATEEMNCTIKPKWLKSIVENQCDFMKENGNSTKTNNIQKIYQEQNNAETKSKKSPKQSNDLKKKNNTNRKMDNTEKNFNSVMLELFQERSAEIKSDQLDIQNNDSMYTRVSKSWNRFLFWWTKWKRDFTTNTIHQFLKSYDPVMRTFECIFLFFETFRIPYPIRYAVHQIRHFLYLLFQFVWTSTFLFEENSEFERELLSHNRRNDSQIYNTDPRYYFDDVNYYSQY